MALNLTTYRPTVEEESPIVNASGSASGSGIQFHPNPQYPLVLDGSQPAIAEYFCLLRSRVSSLQKTLGHRTFVVTSAGKGEGKSLVSLNLALSIGQLGQKRVLLLDGDLRMRSLSHMLTGVKPVGLCDFLAGKESFEAVVQPTSLPALSFVAAGDVRENSLPGLLEGPRWPEFVEQAKQQFDLLILDSVPAGAPVADFDLLAAPLDAILIVVRMRGTSRAYLERVLPRLDRKKFLSVIINDAEEPKQYDDYYYYRYFSRKKPR